MNDTQTLDKKLEGRREFFFPNFNDNGYNCSKYRMSDEVVKFEGLKLPSRVEVLNTSGEWQQFPVIFIHRGTYENAKKNAGSLIIFLAGGSYTSRNYNSFNDDKLLKDAKNLGLTEGNIMNAKSYYLPD
ncbi:MAG TPA: hypothetical protein VEC16_03925 [Alphaproteobacteria bacterium]|nr:hypothetical protein [Alphaproteobacteria bacterium]